MNASFLLSPTSLIILLTGLLRSEAAVSFMVAGSFSTGTNPASVAVADFDDDGKSDLAVANTFSANVSVLSGLGEGLFDTAVNYGTGPGPTYVTTGDFDTNGIPDLVVANGGSSNVTVLLGNGDGAFQVGISNTAGDGPRSVAVGDFNGDGRADLAVANRLSADVSVLLVNSNGVFAAPVNYAAGVDPVSVAAGFFNADTNIDLAVANAALFDVPPSVSVLLGSGDGTFQSVTNYDAGTSPRSIAVEDFNSDGHSDLVAASYGSFDHNYTNSTLEVLLGNGDGTFQPSVGYYAGDGSVFVATGDFDTNGQPDCLVVNNRSLNVAVLLGNGDGTFSAPAYYDAGVNPLSAAVGDLNADGLPDVAVANNAGVLVLLNNTDITNITSISLSAVHTNDTVVISWPFPATGFVLESTTNLLSPNWTTPIESPTNDNSDWEVIVPLNQPQRYFRLHKSNP